MVTETNALVPGDRHRPGSGTTGGDVAATSQGRSRPATMKDIAEETGVSRSTVSRVLSNAPVIVPIAPQTRERVLAAAGRLGYRPNPLARALRGAPTMLLGAIVRDITDPFFAGAIEAVSVHARALGYNIVLGHAHSMATEAHALAAILEARQCDAILMLGDMSDQPELIEELHDTHVPVVALWQGTELRSISAVNVDNRVGIAAAMTHLAGLGHRRIAFVGGRPLGDIQERETAYVEAMARIIPALPDGYVQRMANTAAEGEAALRALMSLPTPPTAIVAATDALAIGVLRGAYVAGVRVPADLSVVGFDDIPWAATTVPALTTVRMPTAEMAAAAIKVAIRLAGQPIRDRPQASIVRVFRPELVVRESTAPPCRSPGGEAQGQAQGEA